MSSHHWLSHHLLLLLLLLNGWFINYGIFNLMEVLSRFFSFFKNTMNYNRSNFVIINTHFVLFKNKNKN